MNTYKVLGQAAVSATTNTDLYTVPALTSTVASTLTICNRGSGAASIRVAVRPVGAALANQHYIIYDTVVQFGDSLFLTIGLSLSTTDVVTVYASNANISFSLFGTEIS
jgi:hypothetical protein